MKAIEVKEFVRRGRNSRIAKEIISKDDFRYEVSITVSQNAPCCIQVDLAYPAAMGWKEIEVNTPLESIGELGKVTEIWIKTATLGGRRRMWIK